MFTTIFTYMMTSVEIKRSIPLRLRIHFINFQTEVISRKKMKKNKKKKSINCKINCYYKWVRNLHVMNDINKHNKFHFFKVHCDFSLHEMFKLKCIFLSFCNYFKNTFLQSHFGPLFHHDCFFQQLTTLLCFLYLSCKVQFLSLWTGKQNPTQTSR